MLLCYNFERCKQPESVIPHLGALLGYRLAGRVHGWLAAEMASHLEQHSTVRGANSLCRTIFSCCTCTSNSSFDSSSCSDCRSCDQHQIPA